MSLPVAVCSGLANLWDLEKVYSHGRLKTISTFSTWNINKLSNSIVLSKLLQLSIYSSHKTWKLTPKFQFILVFTDLGIDTMWSKQFQIFHCASKMFCTFQILSFFKNLLLYIFQNNILVVYLIWQYFETKYCKNIFSYNLS